MGRVDATDRLALLAVTGELVVAIHAEEVFSIRRAVETPSRKLESSLFAVDLDDETVPGWDLGELFKLGVCKEAWIVVESLREKRLRRFALRVGKCLAVRRLPRCLPIPRGVFTSRRTAISGAFATTALDEVKDWPSGIVLDLGGLLGPAEIEAGRRVIAKREVVTV